MAAHGDGERGAPETGDRSARERLLREAAALFGRKGYAATSVGEIVAAAGVTRPVLYYHFENKAGLYAALIDQVLVTLRPEVEASLQRDGRSAADRIRRLSDAIVRTALAHLPAVRLMRALRYAPPEQARELDLWEFPLTIKSALEDLVREGARAGEFSPEQPGSLAWAILGLINVCIDSNLLHSKIALKPRGFRAALELVLAGASPSAEDRNGAGPGPLPARAPRQGDR
jgi:AcrR family transcriptional regulator